MKLRLLLAALLLGEMVLLYDARFGLPDVLAPLWNTVRRAEAGAPTVVFVVLDTVRADHTGMCGYARPNTPYLTSRVAEGAALSCQAYAPGSWTMPSHASFFTGVPVPEHGVHFVLPTDEDRRVFEGTGFYTRPLGEDHPTLAEHFAGQGYQTVSMSANPLIGGDTGLTRGFHTAEVVNKPGWQVVRTALRHLRWSADRTRPLFLFVNLGDAHEPWEPVPAGLDWVPAREGQGWGGAWSPYGLHDVLPSLYPRSDRFDRLMRRELSADEKAEWMAGITDVYDHGIYLADAAVRDLVQGLEAQGWADHGLRVVVTSDHGEHLGEFDLGDHGRFVNEPVVRIPVVAWDTTGPLHVPNRLAGVDLFTVVRDGRMPDPPAEVATYAFGDVVWQEQYGRGGDDTVGVIGPVDKLVWTEHLTQRVDLAHDPLGLQPVPLEGTDHPLLPVLERAVSGVQAADRSGGGVTEDMAERLKAIGYAE